jgi:hypothetical protein
MSSVNKSKALELSSEIRRFYPEYEKLRTKIESKGEKELSEQEVQKYSDLKDKLMKSVENTTKDAYKFVDAPTLVKVQSIVGTKDDKRTVFTYQPKTSASDLIVVTSTEINQTTINGANKKFKGLPDDLFAFGHQPTLQILGRNELSEDNWKPIYDSTDNKMTSEYTISCSFRLNRFPTRTFYRSIDSTYKTNTTRRTEIMRFQYSRENGENEKGTKLYTDPPYNFISIGAVAPYSIIPVETEGNKYRYKESYKEKRSPFSIGVAFPLASGSQTVYTDYKFELKKWYNLRIELRKEDGTTDNTYQVHLYVNDLLQEVALVPRILWNKNCEKLRRKNLFDRFDKVQEMLGELDKWSKYNGKFLIASLPGFNHNSNNEGIREIILKGVDESQAIKSYTGDISSIREEFIDFQFNILSKIVTPPYYNGFLHTNLSLLKEQTQFTNHEKYWVHHKKKMNTSIDYGDISISLK